MRLSSRKIPAFGLAALALGPPSHLHAGLVADGQAGPVFNDNVSQAERRVDRKDDAAMSFSGSAGGRFQVTSGGSLAIFGTFENLDFREHDGLDRFAPGATVSWRQKTRVGARAPWIQVSGSAAFQEFRDGEREGWLHQAKVRFGWPAGEWVGFIAEGAYLRRAAGATVFDQNAFSLAFRADLAIRGSSAVSISYQVRRGDVTSSSEPDPAVLRSAKERAPDPVFGPSFIVYRLEATSQDLQVGVNFALGDHAAVDIAYEGLLAQAAGGIDYAVNQLRASFLYRF